MKNELLLRPRSWFDTLGFAVSRAGLCPVWDGIKEFSSWARLRIEGQLCPAHLFAYPSQFSWARKGMSSLALYLARLHFSRGSLKKLGVQSAAACC